MKPASQKTQNLTLEDSSSLLLDVLGDSFCSSLRIEGASIPGFDSKDNGSNVLLFLDGTGTLDAVKEVSKDEYLAIAFDNRYGFRYFSGLSQEGQFAFEGIEEGKGFSLNEVKKALEDLGFEIECTYYPFPDYRSPKIVYSDSFLPEKGSLRNLIGGVGKDRIVTFDEEKAFDAALDTGDLGAFVPCYLVLARKKAAR